jgi:hypothetical protein
MAWIRNRPLGLVYRDPARSEGGYTLFSSVEGNHATLLDDAGRIVHRWVHPEGIQYARLLPNGHLLLHTSNPVRMLQPEDVSPVGVIGGSAHALIELDWDGTPVWEYRHERMHHDFVRLPNGNHLLLFWEVLPDEVRRQVRGGYQGPEDPDVMLGDLIREVTPSGEVVREWRSWEHFDFADDVLCPLERRREWTHANGIAATPDGRWLVSFRQTDTVIIVQPETGAVDWKWGPGQLSHQHHPTMLDNGHVLLFDNGPHRRGAPGFSRVLEVDPGTNEIVWRYQAPVLLSFLSFMVSGAERLPGGNTLITEGATGRIFEVTPDGETVWEYVSGFMPEGRFGVTPSVFRAHRYATDDARFRGRDLDPGRWAGATAQLARGEQPY